MQAALFVGIFQTASVAKLAVVELSGYSIFDAYLCLENFSSSP